MAPTISTRQRDILEFIEQQIRERGYPPSVREIGDAVGLTSPSTVHSHLNTLQRLGYLRRDPTKPRAIEVRYDVNSGAMMERRPVRHVPLLGDVAAGTDVLAEENVEELLPVPVDFTGDGELFMLRVRGESMIELGILDGDFVVATQIANPNNGDIVVAGIPGGEATIKTYSRSGRRGHPHPGERHDGADAVHRRRGRDLRQGRHGDAPLLSRRRTPRRRRSGPRGRCRTATSRRHAASTGNGGLPVRSPRSSAAEPGTRVGSRASLLHRVSTARPVRA